MAEEKLSLALNEFVAGSWELNESDGAFYGPKIIVPFWIFETGMAMCNNPT